MRFRNILFSLLLLLGFLAVSQPAKAETIIDTDIATDTTWTKAMSPIVLKGQNRSQTIIRVTSGATLTIEAGVTIQISPGMDFYVTNQCLRGYGGEACYRDSAGDIRLPKLIAKGTADAPIIFTSAKKDPAAGDWGSMIIEAKGSDIEWVQFLYGGNRSKRAFVEVRESIFENNLIENGDTVGLWTASQTLTGNSIRSNNGNGIYCSHQCKIENNYIVKNSGNGIELDTLLKTDITGNFFYQNSGNAVNSASILTIPVEIAGNLFMENAGGIYFERSSEGLNFHNNNFLRNTNFAIKSTLNNREDKTYPAASNWFGIDTGSSSSAGEFFVSPEYITTSFAKDGNDFNLNTATQAGKSYQAYLGANNLDEAFFQAKVQRKILAGNDVIPGSLLRYSITFSNLTTKATGITVVVNIPTDQEVLLCSAKIDSASANYVLETACKTGLPGEISFSRNQLIWQPATIAAQKEQTLYFVTALRPDATAAAQLPSFTCNSQTVNYSLDNAVTVGKASNQAVTPAATTATAKTTKTPAKSSNATVVKTIPVANSNTAGELVVGKIYRQIIGGSLKYVLGTSSKRYYILSADANLIREIDAFSKSSNKSKTIAVWGDYTSNKNGIQFTRWEIR
jgi:hypothetical protein